MAKKENTTSIGFEDAIWRAADKLRGLGRVYEYCLQNFAIPSFQS